MPGVEYKCPDGLSVSDMERAIEMIGEHFRIRAATLSDFSPDLDENDRTLSVCTRLLQSIVAAASSGGH